MKQSVTRFGFVAVGAIIALGACSESPIDPVKRPEVSRPSLYTGFEPTGRGIVPVQGTDNDEGSCPAGFVSTVTFGEYGKFQSPTKNALSKSFNINGNIVNITTTPGANNTFDFAVTGGVVGRVFEKSGNNPTPLLYNYNPAVDGDTQLHNGVVDINDPNSAYADVSHISFCIQADPDGGEEDLPAVLIEKDGDPLSKIGDEVTYTFKITNVGDLPLDLVSVIDDKLGSLTAAAAANGCSTLAVDAYCSFTFGPWAVPAGSADPLINTVTAIYNSTGGEASDQDSHSLNLFQPSVDLDKTGPTYSKVGDVVTYTFTITNTSSSDSPNLIIDSFSDPKFPLLQPPAGLCSPLVPGASCTFTHAYTVKALDDTGLPGAQLTNTATVHYHPDGFPNDITDTDSHAVTLLHPKFTVTKSCASVDVNGLGTFTVSLKNTGDAILDGAFVEIPGGSPANFTIVDVAPGQTKTFNVTKQLTAANKSNTVNYTITLDQQYALPNTYTGSATGTCDVQQASIIVLWPASNLAISAKSRTAPGSAQGQFIIQNQSGGNFTFVTLGTGAKGVYMEFVAKGGGSEAKYAGICNISATALPAYPSGGPPPVSSLNEAKNYVLSPHQSKTFYYSCVFGTKLSGGLNLANATELTATAFVDGITNQLGQFRNQLFSANSPTSQF